MSGLFEGLPLQVYKFYIIQYYFTYYGLYQGVITEPRMVASEALPNLLLLLITHRWLDLCLRNRMSEQSI